MTDLIEVLTLTGPVRLFREHVSVSGLLSRQDRSVGPGSSLNVGEPVTMVYDHNVQLALPVDYEGNSVEMRRPYILWRELSATDKEVIRGLFPECILIARTH